jgi:UDP-GlcNAc:undecaprenyl-phosphate GlcNAc-1-phosphate transferase
MYNFLFISVLIVVTIYFSLKYRFSISQKLNLIDFPNERKDHKFPTPIIGGLLAAILISEFFFYNFFVNINEFEFSTYFLALVFFFIGLTDDMRDIKPWIKLWLSFLVLLIFFYNFQNYTITTLNFYTFNKQVYLNNYFSMFFSILCIALLLNAFNMTDGINGLFLGISIICFSYIFISYDKIYVFLIFLILILFVLFLLNIINLFFMGDSGVYLIVILLSTSIISAYKSELSDIKSVEEIFLLFLLPGIDMFRIFLERILNKKSPFKADKNHFHHLLKNKIGRYWSISAYFLIILFGLFLKYININIIFCILIILTIYFYLLFILKKK